MTARSTKVTANQLSSGMFVESIKGREINAFPVSGMLIETKEQLENVRSMCTVACIDLTRSSESVYKHWSATKSSMSISDNVYITAVEAQPPQTMDDFHLPQLNSAEDRYGYKGRFVYRVLENHIHDLIEGRAIELELLEKQLSEFIWYTHVNPDLLQLESRLTTNADSLAAIALRSIIHICQYAKSFNKKDAFVEPIAMNLVVYIMLLKMLPKSVSRHGCFGDEADNAILSSALMRSYKKLCDVQQFPLHVKKTMSHLCERHNGTGPLRLSGAKIATSAQLINLAFTFELMQSTAFNSRPSSSSESIAYLRNRSGDVFNPQHLEKMLQILPLFPTGTILKVGDHQRALVTQQHPLRKLNPYLLALTDGEGIAFKSPQVISSEVRLGSLCQDLADQAHQHEEAVRDVLEIKIPWYKRLLDPTRFRGWLERLELVG